MTEFAYQKNILILQSQTALRTTPVGEVLSEPIPGSGFGVAGCSEILLTSVFYAKIQAILAFFFKIEKITVIAP
ncbi:MAG: hypothetical protein K2M01_07705, partial [Paramuribaculum sp.]|nr:hypothetical protein [Paramuribaculum sp.]